MSELPNVVLDHLVDYVGWTHLDYAIAVDADRLVYEHVVNLFNDY